MIKIENNNFRRISFITLGCKVNQYESNAMAQRFLENGYEIVETENEADICIVNTCTVTNMSDKKSRQVLRKIKDKFPNIIVVATGCYAQVATDRLKKIKEIDLVLGNNEKSEIVELVEKYIQQKEKIYKTTDVLQQKEFKEIDITTYTEKTRAVIKVQDGCDRFCSYCIIPYARGRVRSRNPKNVIEEIEKIAQKGIKEVVITGIHVASYGKDFSEEYKLIDLLEEINKIEGIKRIRLGSIEPTLINESFIERAIKIDKLCHHFHLSLQSGCNETLKRMNRKYSSEEFEKVVNLLRNTYKDVILTTDIIVGFPGETEEEFLKTYEFLKKIKFYKMHVFKYSPRKGTKAEKMENQIDGNIKEERSNKLIELSNKNQREYNEEYVGKGLEVLIEGKVEENVEVLSKGKVEKKSEENVEVLIEEKPEKMIDKNIYKLERGYYQGHTQNYIMVKINENIKNEKKANNESKHIYNQINFNNNRSEDENSNNIENSNNMENRIIKVQITKADVDYVIGKM